MEKIKEDIEQVKVQLLTGIKLGRVEKEWGNMIIETYNRALTIPVVVGRSEQYCDWCSSTEEVEVTICKKCRQGMDEHR